MTTIAHQGVGVPMSQPRSGSPDNGEDGPVDEPPVTSEVFQDDVAELAEPSSQHPEDDVPPAATDTDPADLDTLADLDGVAELADLAEVDDRTHTVESAEPTDPGVEPADTDRTDSTPIGRVLSFRRSRVEPDRSQLIELYQSQRLRLTRLAILLVDDMTSAEDVVQDAFVELHRRWDTLVDKDSAAGYLRVSVLNKARSALRRRRTARNYSPPVERAHDQAAEAVVLAEEHSEVLAAVKRLPPRQREILVLRYWSDLTEAEIADTLGISRGAVKSTASRALDAMERMLEGKK